MPATNTTGNSRPLAEWIVIIVMALDCPASESRSLLRASHSMNAGSFSAATGGSPPAPCAATPAGGAAAAPPSSAPASRSCSRLSSVAAASSCVSSNSCATPKNSLMFSTLPSASMVCSASSAWISPVRSMIICTTSARSPSKWRAASIAFVKPASAFLAFALRTPGSVTHASAAEKNDIPRSAA